MDEKSLRTEIQKLIDKFERVKSEGRYKSYNEENTKKDFILPLFRALGWNVEDSEEVKAEEKVSKKRVDYAFRINGVPKFYLEAKPFREFISEAKYAKQAIEYAWNKSVTWAILCNFEGIRVFNAEWKWNDKQPMRNQFLDLRYSEYLGSCFKYLTWLSRDSFEQGVLDQQATILGKKAKKLPIGQQLLTDFTEYRNILSKDILKNNQKMELSQIELDEIVQRILDRIIFIRTCEDKGIESEKLESLVRMYSDKEGRLYKELNKRFREYDNGYNSKLFLEHLCEKVIVSNDVLKQIISGTHRSKNLDIRYDFSAINADVLGNIYEQYLGHILKSTQKRAKITNGKAHRKEQGIYYTPTYIVDYIVRNTLGEKLKKRGVKVDELKILDPACGSGSFLLKGFDILSEYVTKKEGRTQQAKFEDTISGSNKILKRKTEALKNCIFGVDLDPQAVEIAQLNLLLKLAEKRQRLPTLQDNIKCGNSLINDTSIAGESAFDWNEQFKAILDNGGFDVIVGNPPYVNIYLLSKNKDEVNYFKNNYYSAYKKFDLYVLFIEKAIKLLEEGGFFSFIIPDKFLSQPYGLNLRKFILDTCCIKKIVDLSDYKIFQEATVDNIIIVLQKEKNRRKRNTAQIKIVKPQNDPNVSNTIDEKIKFINQKIFYELPENMFRLDIDENKLLLKNKIESSCIRLSDICYVNWGARSGDIKTYVLKENINKLCKPMLDGRDIDRYKLSWDNKYLLYDKEKLYNPMFEELFENEKLIIRDVNAKEGIKATFDKNKYYTEHTVSLCLLKHQLSDVKRRNINFSEKNILLSKNFDLKYILAILNSNLITFYFNTFISCGLHVYPDNIRAIPIKNISKEKQKKIANLVEKILILNEKIVKIGDRNTDQKYKLEIQIENIYNEINKVIYKIFEITSKEIELVESSVIK